MNLRDCLEAIADLLEDHEREERDRAVSTFRQLIRSGASAEIAAQGMVDSSKFPRQEVLHAIETVLGRSSEEASQILTRGRFTKLSTNEEKA